MAMLGYKIYSESKTISHEKPVIVMLHGLGGGYANWYGQVHTLKHDYDLLLIELPSHGRSPVKLTQMEISYQQVCEKILEVLDFLGIQKAHFLGVSFGTTLVKYIALRYPDRVNKYILAGPIANFNFLLRMAINMIRWFLPIMPMKVVIAVLVIFLMPFDASETCRKIFLHTAKHLSNKESVAYAKLLLKFKSVHDEYTATMGEEINGMYLVGEMDHFFLLLQKKDHRPIKNMVLIPDAGHVCITDQAAVCNNHILSFLSTGNACKEPAKTASRQQPPLYDTVQDAPFRVSER